PLSAPQIPCSVQPFPQPLRERIRYKSLCRQGRLVQISTPESGASKIYLTANCKRHRVHPFIKHITFHVTYWVSQRCLCPKACQRSPDLAVRSIVGAFCGSVGIQQRDLRVKFGPFTSQTS